MAGTRRGFGVAAAIAPEVIRAAAEMAEAYGYDSFWVNDNPAGDGLAALGEAAVDTTVIKLGVGVIALSRRSPQTIINQLNGMDLPVDKEGRVGETMPSGGSEVIDRGVSLPMDRLLLGVGSGAGGSGSLQRVRDGVAALKNALDVPVFISALGPKMSHLAGEVADGVLFNWITPEYAEISVRYVQEGADAAQRPLPALYAYVRTALGPAAQARLRQEAARYGRNPNYASNFRRMGIDPADTAIVANTPDEIQEGLARWGDILDELVVRSITAADTIEETIALVQAAAPLR